MIHTFKLPLVYHLAFFAILLFIIPNGQAQTDQVKLIGNWKLDSTQKFNKGVKETTIIPSTTFWCFQDSGFIWSANKEKPQPHYHSYEWRYDTLWIEGFNYWLDTINDQQMMLEFHTVANTSKKLYFTRTTHEDLDVATKGLASKLINLLQNHVSSFGSPHIEYDNPQRLGGRYFEFDPSTTILTMGRRWYYGHYGSAGYRDRKFEISIKRIKNIEYIEKSTYVEILLYFENPDAVMTYYENGKYSHSKLDDEFRFSFSGRPFASREIFGSLLNLAKWSGNNLTGEHTKEQKEEVNWNPFN